MLAGATLVIGLSKEASSDVREKNARAPSFIHPKSAVLLMDPDRASLKRAGKKRRLSIPLTNNWLEMQMRFKCCGVCFIKSNLLISRFFHDE